VRSRSSFTMLALICIFVSLTLVAQLWRNACATLLSH
jgi:hypothetical protein